MSDLHDERAVAVLERQIDEWLRRVAGANPAVEAVDKAAPDDVAPSERRWYVRLRGEEKDVTTIWLTLGQRTLRYETYVMPSPAANAAEVYELLLRRNDRLVGAHFSIGAEDAVFLRGEVPLVALSELELDRVVGSLFDCVERWFVPLARLGFPGWGRHT